MWQRNLLFAFVCLSGAASLSAMLLVRQRIQDPPGYDPRRTVAEDYREVIARVDDEFAQEWARRGIQPVGAADQLQVIRRLAVGLMGTIPSLEEIRALERLPPEQRVEWWLTRVLADRRCSDYVAERFARAFVGTDQGAFLLFRRRRFVTWLSDQLAANRPYDELVRELVTAQGLWTDSPAVNFLTAAAGGNEGGQPDDIKLAGRTARAFLATRLDCLQCHDDKLGVIELGQSDVRRYGEQTDFHGLAAYFSQAETSLFGIRDGKKEYRYKFLDEDTESLVDPHPPFLTELLPSAQTRRQQLAAWLTHPDNKPFARAAVNRVWAILCGQPLVEPIDSIPLFGPFPPGLETLAEDFVRRGCDVQRLIRIIAATRIYQLDSRCDDFSLTPAHQETWAVFPLSRLRPDQVAGGIIQSASLSTIDANAHIVAQLRRYFQERDFVKRYGDLGAEEFQEQPETITQRLLLMNGKLVKERTQHDPLANAATRIAMLAPDDATALETAFLVTLTRRPSLAEQEHFRQRLAGTSGPKRSEVLEDICWVLINSSEFGWNH